MFGKTKLPQRITNTLNMLDLFQRSYSFRAIIYTNDPVIVSVCNALHIMTDGNYEVNVHNMPIMRYMFVRSQQLLQSHYYGYINSDIVVAPNLFDVLKSCKKLVEKKKIKPRHEIASIVWDVFRLGIINTTSITSYENYLLNHMQYLKQQRDYRSADYFIFSENVDYSKMESAVVGRMRIDNYMMSYIFQQNGSLVDVTWRVIGIHQGLEGYKQHTRSGKRKSDLEWNYQWLADIQKAKGSLQFADYRFAGDEYTRFITKRFSERRNVVKLHKMSRKEKERLKIVTDLK
ncbi:hypothetical protein AV274_1106 [Blastocystis sp. ATCC 50177/Nand II]|uniref:Uncharacterized protein n=1 Tax=Blastocystis sp. subtype 1 (strain ATCC 50177 / NandII) TaxID=478820 RepID=A0A196SLT2_BLAHN|nr:hypothetical protein AV274_1106 [Blastocystis sp. ATCC 50177/Nand II]